MVAIALSSFLPMASLRRVSKIGKHLQPNLSRTMHIQAIPILGSGQNYAYIISDPASKTAAIIDPAEPKKLIPILREQIASGEINLTSIINTHHHQDHAGGNRQVLEAFPHLDLIGGKDCALVKTTPKDGEIFHIGGIAVKSIYTPCHTQDSICFFAEHGHERAVFTGDTLFIAGCGRFFEGTAAEMHTALNSKLATLSEDTKIYPGHEYTASNAKFASKVMKSDALDSLIKYCDENEQTCGKFTIGDEKRHNPFMRLSDPAIQKATGETDPVGVMAKLREMKNKG